jgi:type II secretory pathway component PulF
MAMNEHHAGKDGSLRASQVGMLVQAVGAAAASRVPLDVTLAALAEEKDDRRLAAVAGRLATRLQQGATIDQAIAEIDRDVPAEVHGLLRAGIECGDLAGTFERFSIQRLTQQRINGQIRAAVAYPLVIFAILVPLALFLCIFVIPMFGEMFEEFDLDLPQITLYVLQISGQMPALIGGLLAIIVAIPILMRIAGGRWLFHRIRAATPILGRLWTWAGQREFAALLASFLDLRLPLAVAVAHTGEIISDRNLARACRGVSERLTTGQSLGECLSRSMHFDRSLAALAAWGETHGMLPDALRIATDVFDDRVEQQVSLVRRLLPPVTLITVATAMFFVIVSLMVPLVKLIEGLA